MKIERWKKWAGQLDDLVLIPLGVALALRMIPSPVMAECRQKAQTVIDQGNPTNWAAAAAIVAIWLFLAALAVYLIVRVN